MFGAWQVGAWRWLASRLRPDVVIGASVGALNGWAIASLAPPEELAAAWLDPEIANLIRWRVRASLFDPRPLHHTVRLLMERYRPSIPYATTVVEAARLRLRLVRAEEMRAEHLAAACAFPCGFPPVRVDGRWCVDGGLLGALPLWAAAEMGCERAIALDALPFLPSRTVAAAARLARRIGNPRPTPAALEVVKLRPSTPLGSLSDALFWNPTNAAKWIAQGERDARLSITM